MPRSATTGVYTRTSNSFSQPVFGTIIDPADADVYFDDLDVGLNPPELGGPVRFINSLQVGTTGTAAGTVDFLNATSGSITISPPTGALGTRTLTLPVATDTLVGKATTDTLTNKTFDTAGTGNSLSINGVAVTANTGTGAVVRETSPTLVTPTLGVAAATSYNKVTITAPATAATLTLIDGTTLTGPAASGTVMTLGNTETVSGQKNFTASVGISQASPEAPLHVGGVAMASTVTNILSARANTGSVAVHGFAENSTYNMGAAALGINDYDARAVFTGTQTYDHHASFQSRPSYGSSGTITNMYGFYDGSNVDTGTATNLYGHYMANATGTGTVTNHYGFYSEALTKGATLNYAFFAAGATKSKFTGGLEGTTTNDSAAAGCIGEFISSNVPIASAVSLVTNTAKDVTTISLTAGDWDVWGNVNFELVGTSTANIVWISTTANTLPTRPNGGAYSQLSVSTTAGMTLSAGVTRLSLSGTTTVSLGAQATWTGTSMAAGGFIGARRIR